MTESGAGRQIPGHSGRYSKSNALVRAHTLMNLRFSLCVLLSVFAIARASGQPAAPSALSPSAARQRTSEQLDQLLGPIALYPDALIALILPSATEPADVVLAARYFNGKGDSARIDDQPWDDSVKALAHYPAIVKWMDENLTWTKQVGGAFLDQPADVMKSVQRLRAAARAAGTLIDTPQQQVVAQGETIIIVPAQPDIIYVPSYDPEVVYVRRRGFYPGPFLTFGVGYSAGFWLGYDLDWDRRRLWVINRPERERYWREHHDWHPPVFPHAPDFEHDPWRRPWNPNPVYVRPSRPSTVWPHQEIVRPVPFSHEPWRPPAAHENRPGWPDRSPENRDQPWPSPEERRVAPRRPENFPTAPTANPVQPLTPPSRPPRVNSGPERDDRGGRENRRPVGPQDGTAINPPAAGRLIPPPLQPNVTSPQQGSPASRQNRPPPTAAPALPQSAPVAPQEDKEGRRERQAQSDRQN